MSDQASPSFVLTFEDGVVQEGDFEGDVEVARVRNELQLSIDISRRAAWKVGVTKMRIG